jgi:hypothetical protein
VFQILAVDATVCPRARRGISEAVGARGRRDELIALVALLALAAAITVVIAFIEPRSTPQPTTAELDEAGDELDVVVTQFPSAAPVQRRWRTLTDGQGLPGAHGDA